MIATAARSGALLLLTCASPVTRHAATFEVTMAMRSDLRFTAPVMCVVAALSASCDARRAAESEPEVNASPGQFSAEFRRLDTLRLVLPPDVPLIRVSGLAFGPAGQLLIADVSEGNVKWFDRGGRLVRVLGRRGDGPGEFSQPRFPRFGPDGRVYVADGMMSRVGVFDARGELSKTVSLGGFSPLMGFAVAGDGRFVLGGVAEGGTVVHVANSTGRILQSYLASERTLPRVGRDSPFLRPVTQHWLAIAGDTVYAASTLSDSLWQIALGSGRIRAVRLVVPGYVPPVPAQGVAPDVRSLMAWTKSFHIAATVLASQSTVAVPFVQGVLNYGDPMILAVRGADGRWRALTGAPPVVAVNGDTLVTLEHPDAETVTLGFYVATR